LRDFVPATVTGDRLGDRVALDELDPPSPALSPALPNTASDLIQSSLLPWQPLVAA